MQVFIYLPNGKNLVCPISDNDKIINIKRFIAEKLNFDNWQKIYDMRLTCGGRTLYNNLLAKSVLFNDATVHLVTTAYSGPESVRNEKSLVYFMDNSDGLEVEYSPNDKVIYILQYILETLIKNKILSDGLVDDFHLKLGDKILDASKCIAEYPELSTSFISFHTQNDFINNSPILSKLINKLGSYYQIIFLGHRKESDAKLKFCAGPQNIGTTNNCCLTCDQDYTMILPCCRKRSCYQCYENNIIRNNCAVCSKQL
jgi:hypothetical protein